MTNEFLATTDESDTIRANVEMRFYRRYLLIGVVFLGCAGWFAYDGAIAWPAQRERALKFKELHAESLDAWHEYADQQGWSRVDPGEPKTPDDFFQQFIWAGIAATIGAIMMLVSWLPRGRWIEASETGVTSSWEQSFDFDQVRLVNKKKWIDKGIAFVEYERDGRKKRFVIDDYKFDRYPTDAILYRLESNIDHDLVTGGPPEPPPGADEEEADEPASEELASEESTS